MTNVVPGGNNLINAKQVLEKAGVTSGMKVGDFGCGGMGYFSLTAAELVGSGPPKVEASGVVYAVDILKTVLKGVEEIAKARGLDNVKIIWSNLEIYGATKIEGASLDIGFLINTLFQTKNDEAIIKECVRMIKPGGKLLVIDWKSGKANFGPATRDRVDVGLVKKVALDLGLREAESFDAGKYHWAMVFVK